MPRMDIKSGIMACNAGVFAAHKPSRLRSITTHTQNHTSYRLRRQREAGGWHL